MDGRAPYKALLTHGFVVDGKGLKMSKSKGNVIAPQKIADTLGAEILRLWVAATDYSGELSISDEILKRVVEAYRRIRNTLRFLLANTSDFDPATRHAAGRAMAGNRPLRAGHDPQLQAQCEADYERFEFHRVVQSLQTFCSEDLGGFYLDILKDRLYTTAAGSPAAARRRRAVAHPAVPDQADGAGSLLHRRRNLAAADRRRRAVGDAADLAAAAGAGSEAELLEKWRKIRSYRGEVMRALEELRIAGKHRLVAAGRGEICTATARNTNCSLRSATTCALSSSARRRRDSRRQRELRARRCRTPSASAAGTCAPTSAPTPSTPASAAAASSNLHGEGETRAFA
jgi:isoleucyl-tRNA synthetase